MDKDKKMPEGYTDADIKDSWNEQHQRRIEAFEKVDPKFAELLKKYQNTHKVEDASDKDPTKRD